MQGVWCEVTSVPRNTLILAVLALVLLPSGDAWAWGNGEGGPNAFGTHDQILREAVRISHQSGDWICLRVALRATDDPDTLDGIDHASGNWWHVWDEWGEASGGAPGAVRVWYRRVQRQLAHDHRCGASRALGIMSHMLADVAQPMHTDGRLDAEARVRAGYEHEVDTRCSRSTCQFPVENMGVSWVSPYPVTVTLARVSHKLYGELVRTYDRDGFTRRVKAITRRQINLGANVLAALIRKLGA